MFIDTHAHITSDVLYDDVEALLQRACDAKVSTIICIATDAMTLNRALMLKEKHPQVLVAAATTPHDVATDGEAFFSVVEKYALSKSLIAIGETGLDYYYEHSEKNVQRDFLVRYLSLAKWCGLPAIFHCREAFDDLFAITDAEYKGRALIHCFTGSIEEARQAIDRGWYISFSGIISFKRSESLRSVVKFIPLDRMVIETDAPYLAPLPFRGKTNEPAYIIETAKVIAGIKGISLEDVARTTSSNADAFFSL
jgi:TatD DNase family protein